MALLRPHTDNFTETHQISVACRTWLDGRRTAFFPVGSASSMSSLTVSMTTASTPFLKKSHPLFRSFQDLLDKGYSCTVGQYKRSVVLLLELLQNPLGEAAGLGVTSHLTHLPALPLPAHLAQSNPTHLTNLLQSTHSLQQSPLLQQ